MALLKEIYAPFEFLIEGTEEYNQLASSAKCFLDWFQPFQDRKEMHNQFMNEYGPLPQPHKTKPYRLRASTAIRLTQRSCLDLEGNSITKEESFQLFRSIAKDLENGTTKPEDLGPSKSEFRNMHDLNEVYNHLVALYYSIGLTQRSGSFLVEEADILNVHSVLLGHIPNKAGKYRRFPIQITSFPKAVFPYPKEVPRCMELFVDWMKHSKSHSSHPILFACDVFLNFCHIHPFQDGNGRMGRILVGNLVNIEKGGLWNRVYPVWENK